MRARQKAIRNYRLVLFAFILLACGCSKEEHEPLFLSIEVDRNYPMSTEEWLFATDAEGNVLDVKSVSGRNITIQLHGNTGSLPTFTLHHMALFFSSNNPFLSVFARSYTDVPVGSVWHLAPSPFTGGQPFSSAFITINDFQGPINGGSTPSTGIVSSVRGNDVVSESITGSNAVFEVRVNGVDDFVVSSLYNDNSFHYGLLYDVLQGTHRTISLQPMDLPLLVDRSDVSLMNIVLSGYHIGDDVSLPGYVNCLLWQNGIGQPLIMGYIHGFNRYRTLIVRYDDLSIKTYDNLGSPLSALPDFDNPEMTVSSEMMNALVGSISIPYTYAILDFHSESPQHYLNWTVWRNGHEETSFDYKLPALPEVVASRFPVLKVEFARLTGGLFVQNKDDYQYNDKLNDLADPRIKHEGSTEYFSYKFGY